MRSKPFPRRLVALLAIAIVPAVVLGVFVGALSAADTGHATVPAAIVNNDTLLKVTKDGRTTYVAAGRLIVSSLTKPSTAKNGAAIDWQLSNASEAAKNLKAGLVYAVVTIPKDFSKSINTVGTTDSTRAHITIATDEAHGYVVSQISSVLGSTLTSTLGTTTASRVIEGLYGGYGTLAASLGEAASGAGKLGGGANALASGLDRLASGQQAVASGVQGLGTGASSIGSGTDALATGLDRAASGASDSASGAKQLASGVATYTKGVDSLSSGLSKLASGSKGLQQLPDGVQQYTGGVSQISTALAQVLAADTSTDATTKAQLQALQGQLATLAGSGSTLVTGAEGAATVQSGIASAASGATRLSGGSAALRTGTSSLASGLGSLATGIGASASGAKKLGSGADTLASGSATLASAAGQIAAGIGSSASGAAKLGSGATTLSSGLTKGASSVPSVTAAQGRTIASVAAAPVSTTSTKTNTIANVAQAVATLIIPVGLWIGASAVVLVFGAVRRRLLATGVGTGRLVGGAFVRGAGLAVAQAVVLMALLEATAPLRWAALPAVFGVAVLAAISFFAVHQFLGVVFGRAGTVVSVLLLGVQLVAVGGLYPIELVAAPFQVLSPWLPLTSAVTAIQSLTAGSSSGVGGAVVVLLLLGMVAFGLTTAVTARRRTSPSFFALAPAATGL